MAVTVKVGQVPGLIREFAIQEGSTVASVLTIADLQLNNEYTVTVNGESVDAASAVLNEDATVLLTRKIRGA